MKNYFNTKGPQTEEVWEPLQQVLLSLCIKEPWRSSQGGPNLPQQHVGRLALRPVDGTLRLPPQLTEQLPLCLERWGCTPVPSQPRSCLHLHQLYPRLPGSPLKSFLEKLYSAGTSWIKPQASPEASRPAGDFHKRSDLSNAHKPNH